MFMHLLRFAFRNLLRSKSFSVINIVGLTAGTVCCLYILLYVNDQYRFDRHHTDVDRIFRITTDLSMPNETDRMATVSPAIMASIQNDFPEVEVSSRVVHRPDVNEHLFQTGAKSIYVSKGYYADPTFFSIFTYDFIEGTRDHCLDEPLTMVISSTIAEALFGSDAALGKVISMTDNFGTNDYLITGVFDNANSRSHMRPNFVINLFSGRLGAFIQRDDNWAGSNYAHGYLKLRPGADPKLFEEKLNSYVAIQGKEQLRAAGMTKQLHLQPVGNIHTSSNLNHEIDTNTNATFLSMLIAIACFIQLIACINFMNLSTARSASRAKEIGVRKTAGAGKASLIRQFLCESVLVTVISAALALQLLAVLLPFFNQVSQYNLSVNFSENSIVWIIVLMLIIVTGIIAGSYPAFYLSSFRPVDVLKGKFSQRLSGISLRKGLVVFQFVTAGILLIALTTVRKQVNYLQEKELGFNKDQKIVIPIRSRKAIVTIQNYKNEISQLSEVAGVAGTLYHPGFRIEEDIELYPEGKTIADTEPLAYNVVDESYFAIMEIPLVAGRPFLPGDTLNQIIINEAAVRAFGLTVTDAPGKQLLSGNGDEVTTYTIVAVVKDYNFASLHEPIKPLFFRYNNRFPNLIVSARSDDYKTLLAKLQSHWKQFNPDQPFEYFFLNDKIQNQYETENTLLRIVNVFSVLAIFICCLGLFGLTAFTVDQRVKEIGIRKVLGATATGIAAMLSREFIALVLIAILLASPLAAWLMNLWLQGFAYRIEIGWEVFVFVGMICALLALLTVGSLALKAGLINPARSLKSE